MGILDFIFGDKDDSVEDATPSHPLETVPGWQRPIGATTNDQQVGEDDMGNPVFRTTLGGTYTVRVNPDQRTIRQKVEDAAPAVVDAVTDYAQNPTLPSKEAVGQFAYDATIGAAQELDALMFENDGTIGDVLATATAAGTGGMVASRALQEPMENAMGMFLNVRTPTVDSDSLKEAKDMARQGVDRDEIWKKTGWGRVAGEWVTESDDSQSGIMLTDKYRPRPGTMEEQTVEKTVTTAPDRNQRISAKTNARVRRNEIMAKMQSGELSREEGLAQLKALETELEGNLQGQTQTVTETVKVQKPATALKSTGTLSEVLGNEELTPFLDGKDPPATVGVAYKSAGSLGSYDPNTKLIKAYDQKDLPNTRNDADQLIRDELDNIKAKYGENSPEYKVAYSNAIADAIWSTTLHEVQHYIQDVNDFLGQGSNLEDAAKIAKIVKKDFAAGVKDIADQQPVKVLMKELSTISGTKVPNTRAARIEILEYLYAYEEVMRQGMAEDEAFAALLPELRKSYGILRPEAEQLINYVKQDPELIGSMSDFTDLQNSTVGMINRLGGNNFDIYRHDAGEVMSRLTQARRNMSTKERRENPPWTMYKEVGVFDEGAIYSADDMLRQKSYSWDEGYPDLYESMGENGALLEFPGIAEKLDGYIYKNNRNALSAIFEDPDYPAYKENLAVNLSRTFGDSPIPVARIEGYSDVFSDKNKINLQVFSEDVLLVGNPDEKELVIRNPQTGRIESVRLEDPNTDFLDKSIDNFNTIRQIFDVDEEYAKEVATQVLSGDPFSDIISDDQFEQLKNSIYLKTQDFLKDYPDEITVYRAGDVPEGTVKSFTLNPNYDPDFVGNAPGSKGAPLVAYTVKKSDILASPDITARGPIGEDEVIINTNSVLKTKPSSSIGNILNDYE